MVLRHPSKEHGHHSAELLQRTGSGSAGSGAAPPACKAPALEGVVWVDGQRPDRAGVGQVEAEEAQALPTALRAGQQRHLLGGYLRSGNHSRLGVALQLPQVCGDKVAQTRREALRTPGACIPTHSAQAPTTSAGLYTLASWASPWNRESSSSWLKQLGLA